ncbi:unnamed protein product [Thelazia callipaeda]|uniref:Clip domain-containing protein n=1 Tax=Thelazia callipaeda TaxID=103827 RepID=A0A0N5D4Q3_THECL|nr:unnamed protein product [Thelazia callipaeda]
MCNTNRGPSACLGDFCDIHNRDGKRAACGALRRSRQTIFSCVFIRQNSNDTYCHVIGSVTACWCRQMDFCNADLEAELFDVDEISDDNGSSKNLSVDDTTFNTSEREKVGNDDTVREGLQNEKENLEHKYYTIKNNLQKEREPLLVPEIKVVSMSSFHSTVNTSTPTTGARIHDATTRKSTLSASTTRSVKKKIQAAVQIDAAERIEVKPEGREQPSPVAAEPMLDSYEYDLNEK